jgi:alkylation response protein AidB-like acyl-CoA dehydrogenase
MLMTMRAFNEGGARFLFWTAIKAISRIARRMRKERQKADDHMGADDAGHQGLLTDKGFEHAVMAQQIFGGHGYIEEHGMSQFVRDARIAMIYEGANGIQALDLVGRKLAPMAAAPCRPSSRRSASSAKPTAPTTRWRPSQRR